MPRLRNLAAVLLLVACGSRAADTNDAGSKRYPTILEAPPYPPIVRLGPEPTPQTRERRRWLFEQRVEERELALLRRIKAGEISNFGGVEWRWRDGPRTTGLADLPGQTEAARFAAMQAIKRDIWLLNDGGGNPQGSLPAPRADPHPRLQT